MVAYDKDQWKSAVGKVQPQFASLGVLNMSRNDFIALCGQPDKTEALDDQVYWYYACSDGTIQLKIAKGPLEAAGIVLVTQVNDF